MAGLGRNEFDDFRDEYNRLRNCRPVLTFAELQAAFNEGGEPRQLANENDRLAAEYDEILEAERSEK